MKNVTMKQLMILERILLEINTKYKFQLEFSDAYNLYKFLKDIGSVTNYMFLLQDEFREQNDNIEDLKEYHNKLMNAEVDFNEESENIIYFINLIVKYLDKEELTELVNKLKFW